MEEATYKDKLTYALQQARINMYAFCLLIYPPIASTFIWSKLHVFLMNKVQGVYDGTSKKKQTVSVPPQHGKQIEDDEVIFTSKGWKRHGDLQVGDYVYHPSGKSIRVNAIIPQVEKCSMRVTLSNGQTVVVHPNHEWTVFVDKRGPITLETKEILRRGLWRGQRGSRGARCKFQLPISEGVEGVHKQLTVEPYFLGVWLGDGKSSRPQICGVDDEVFSGVGEFYHPTSEWTQEDTGVKYSYYGDVKLMRSLKDLGVLDNKHIPVEFMNCSRLQRLELLAGLIDSDGSLAQETGQYRFINCNQKLIRNFCHLISSLGYQFSITSAEPCISTSGIEGKQTTWYVGFTPHDEIPCRVPRKQSNYLVKRKKVAIIDIDVLPIGEHKSGKCITVDSDDGLYLVGEKMVPTHNSQILSKLAVAWMLGARPGITIAITGFSHTLVTKFSKDVKAIVSMPIYRMIFPNTEQVYGSDKVEEWELTNGSALIAKSAGSKLTGRRVDWLIIDDPHAGREEAESPTMRRKIQQWYFADCVTRLSPGAAIFVIATRWHPEDLIGYLTSENYVDEITASGVSNIEDELFEVTNIPALCENEATDPLGRKMGDAAFPEVRNVQFLENLKATLPAYEWRSQYQGDPKSSGSGQADVSKIQYCDINAVPRKGDSFWFRGWDLALSEEQSGDFSAGPLICYDHINDVLYIVEVFKKKLAWVKLKAAMFDVIEQDIERDVHAEGIEAVAGFGAVFAEVKHKFLGRMKVLKRNPKKSKLSRAGWWFNKIEAGRVFLVRAPWNKDFIDELSTFPDGNHDDQIDGVSIASELIPLKYRRGKKVKEEPSGDGSSRPNVSTRPKGRTRLIDV